MKDPKFNDVEVRLTGRDGNAFSIIGAVSRALKKAGYKEGAEEYKKAAFSSSSYNDLLVLTMETVVVT